MHALGRRRGARGLSRGGVPALRSLDGRSRRSLSLSPFLRVTPHQAAYLSTLQHPGRHRHPSREARARNRGEDPAAIPDGADRPSPAGRPANPSPSAYGEWPGRINRKAGISFRRCGSALPRLSCRGQFRIAAMSVTAALEGRVLSSRPVNAPLYVLTLLSSPPPPLPPLFLSSQLPLLADCRRPSTVPAISRFLCHVRGSARSAAGQSNNRPHNGTRAQNRAKR